ncbi:MAG: enoyl-CoA hydratase/isomerase family protein [Spirochaetales bacterium]|nr:enoyl-CoA hydratase/isomerase family protein [Leptospiraceae bacterium]MCP5480249.1 enoyl-CoA hydratase/isomerase family protein [Spirochaetales bacterium]MCP5486352.1 enoyl-CoA hydratase/isomerase family protein [Spirochaetales bacterium]
MSTIQPGFATEVQEGKKGRIGFLTIAGIEPNNTLNLELLRGFIQTLYELGKTADGVIVRSAHERFFSNGLDGKTLLESSMTVREETIREMILAYGKLMAFGKPWIVEIAGYAMAGGAVISTAADYRFMLKGGGRIGFSELAVGLPLPVCYAHGMHRIVQPSAVRSLIEGAALKPEEALAIGLIDGVAEDRDRLRQMCIKRMEQILRLEQDSFLPTRMLYRKAVLRDIERDEAEDVRLASELIRQPVFERALNNIAGKNR